MGMALSITRSIAELQAEAERPTLRRALGPLNLTALGIGSVIGTGIFVLTGTAASQNAGPALVLSMIVAAVACALAGLCYAELASMIPVAGSAYTYAYASSGELVAWIIGWDLILEYALSASTIAVGWSGYFVSFLRDLGLALPPQLTAARGATAMAADGTVLQGVFNLPATVIVLLVAALLVIGIKQSADANTALVVLKVAVLIAFVALGAAYVRREHLVPFIPPNTGEFGHFGWSGVMRGAAVMFFAYVGLRRGLDRRPGSQEPAARHADRDPSFAGHLHGPLHRGGHRPDRHRALSAAQRGRSARRRHRRHRAQVVQPHRQGERAVRTVQHDAGPASGPDPHLLLDEPGRPAARSLRRRAPALPDALAQHACSRAASSPWRRDCCRSAC